MTHEQKPESAEFRTREAQKTALAEALEDGMSRSASAEEAERHIAEVEARGAAEQRRKDAEGAEPLGYVTQTGEDGLRHPYAADAFMRGVLNRKMDKFTTPVYTRPANVAALEDRVKELEGVLVEIAHNKTSDCPNADNRLYQDQVAWAVEWCRRKARAAICEGDQP